MPFTGRAAAELPFGATIKALIKKEHSSLPQAAVEEPYMDGWRCLLSLDELHVQCDRHFLAYQHSTGLKS
jgi:hypothetical protein